MTLTLDYRMKRYEAVTRNILLPNSISVLRIDGRSFHTYLRNAERPFDMTFVADMQHVARTLCSEINGAVFAYGQSDEVSLLISDETPQSEPWFGGVVQKMVSVAAAYATGRLIERRGSAGCPHFDARVFTVPSWVEAANYTIWRQRDAVRNSVHMAARAYFSPANLEGRDRQQLQEMLWSQHGINWSNYPDAVRRGWVLAPEVTRSDVSFVHKQTGERENTTTFRIEWQLSSPHLTVDSQLFNPHRLRDGIDEWQVSCDRDDLHMDSEPEESDNK